jgi:hypothetical protein
MLRNTFSAMRNLSSLSKGRQAIYDFAVIWEAEGDLPLLPGIFPDTAPIIRNP